MANNVSQNTDEEKDLEELKQKYTKICQDLCMDSNAQEEAWNAFALIHRNVTLEVCVLIKLLKFMYILLLENIL